MRPRSLGSSSVTVAYPRVGYQHLPPLAVPSSHDLDDYEAAVVAYTDAHAATAGLDSHRIADAALVAITAHMFRRGDRWGSFGPLTYADTDELRNRLLRRYNPEHYERLERWAQQRRAAEARFAAPVADTATPPTTRAPF